MNENILRAKSDVKSIAVLPASIIKKSLEEFKNAKKLQDVPLEIRRREASEWVYLIRYE
jgi:hypothetical protein